MDDTGGLGAAAMKSQEVLILDKVTAAISERNMLSYYGCFTLTGDLSRTDGESVRWHG